MFEPKVVMLYPTQYIVSVPIDAGDFYVSGTGHLCARNPIRHTVYNETLNELGVTGSPKVIGRASEDELRAANLTLMGNESAIIVAARESRANNF